MLTAETKHNIDSARDVLVGKVPDPKTQVDQITNALIYKFMDDMDQEAIELGGKARYFTGEFKKYAWSKLMDPKLGATNRLDLYVEALSRMSQNPLLPQLFRDVFSDAMLPYRDSETLNLFLKQINNFTYHHSEELGNSFEYLLAVLGSQGDAGQFRTPRNIIEFIVNAVNPSVGDRILDPACGTAGFLISSYKHILAEHDTVDNITGLPTEKEESLTPDQRKRLVSSLVGYDISPEMVKLSRVNMYLHNFPEPNISEYDTLTSEDKWDDTFDVILANPPFMTPKGGIQPHKRFSVQAKRTEVLFVDYILEHLTSRGRAGIIVPESIIFQTSGAYKQLRKMLIENGLISVVSLPPGIFLPYASARTSILIIDKEASKKSDSILFLSPRDFGHSLSARKRKIEANDLPESSRIIHSFKQSGKLNEVGQLAFTIKKEAILAEKDCDLSQEYYRDYKVPQLADCKFESLENSIVESKKKVKDGDVAVWSVSNAQGFVLSEEFFGNKVASESISSYKLVEPGYFAYNPARINVGSIAYNDTNTTGAVSPMYVVFRLTNESIDPNYLLAFLKSSQAKYHILRLSQGTVRQQLRFKDLGKIQVLTSGRGVKAFVLSRLDENKTIRKQIDNNLASIDAKIAEVWND